MEQQEAYTDGPARPAGPPEKAEPDGPAGAQAQAAAASEAAGQPLETPAAPEEETREAAGPGFWTRWLRANWPLLAGAAVLLAAAAGLFLLVQRRRRTLPEGIVDLTRERSRRLMQEAARRTRAVDRLTPRLAGTFSGLPQPRLPAMELDVELPRLPRLAAPAQPLRVLPFGFLTGRAGRRHMGLGGLAGTGLRQARQRVRGLLAAA